MGYYVHIRDHSLKPPKRDEAEKVVDAIKGGLKLYYWEWIGNRVDPISYDIKWSWDFVDELVKLAEQGVVGEVVLTGEEGEWFKFILKYGRVEEYNAEIVYKDKPDYIYTRVGDKLVQKRGERYIPV